MQHSFYTQSSPQQEWLTAELQQQIQSVLAQCFAGQSITHYFAYEFLSAHSQQRRLQCFWHQQQLVGFCLITWQRRKIAGRNVHTLGACAAFLPEFRHGNRTLQFSLNQAIKFKLRHPFTPLYYADIMLSPAMYRAMAKAIPLLYPKPTLATPPTVIQLLRHLNPNHSQDPHLTQSELRGEFSASQMHEFRTSDKADIQYYLARNPNFAAGSGLWVVIPVGLAQFTAWLKQRWHAKN